MEKLSIKECIAFGWKTFWSRPWVFVLAGAIIFFVNMLFSLPEELLGGASEMAYGNTALVFALSSLVFSILGMIVSIYLQMGAVRFNLKAHDDVTTAHVRDLFVLKGFWRYLGTSVLVVLAVIAGLILLIVPGIILSIALSFAVYLCVDKGLGPVASFKESLAITKGHRWSIFVLMLAICGINLLGLLALFVGLVVTVPVSVLASIHAYRQLSARREAPVAADVVPETVVATA